MDLDFEIQKTNVRIRISILEIPCVPIFRQNKQFWFFWSKFAQKQILGWDFKNLSLDSESAPPRYHVWQPSVKMDKFAFFGLNLDKLPNYVQHFGSCKVEVVAESRKEAGMSWMEVGGGGWRWVQVGAGGCTFSNTHTDN